MEKEKILISRHFLIEDDEQVSVTKRAYYESFILTKLGILVDKPNKLTSKMVDALCEVFKINVPKSFYKNPQDLRYFNSRELLIEQLVSYFTVESSRILDVDVNYDRIEIFKKELPQYFTSSDVTIRNYYIITKEEAENKLLEICSTLCSYTRPFNCTEESEFIYLIKNGYYKDDNINCKDNIFILIDEISPSFAKYLDKKDLVKYSIRKFGDHKHLNYDSYDLEKIKSIVSYVKDCQLSKKQAKYFNKIIKLCNLDMEKETNAKSAYKYAIKALKDGDVLKAANIFKRNGSLLERNIRMLLSRASKEEAMKIIDMLEVKNPIVLYQFISGLSLDSSKRIFSFKKNGKLITHFETDYEFQYRKSHIPTDIKEYLNLKCIDNIYSYYQNLESLGKVYISDAYNKLALPVSTETSAKGIDVLPAGSRIKIKGKCIRAFVYWNNIYDIDSNTIMIKEENGELSANSIMSFMAYHKKEFNDDILFSGDVRGKSGAEYFDIELNGKTLKERNIRYIIFSFNSFENEPFSKGTVKCGYQDKSDLKTEVWDPKNIAYEFTVNGDSIEYVGFAIDLKTKEMVILNQFLKGRNVTSSSVFDIISKFLPEQKINLGSVLSKRGEVVDNMEEADIVFDDTYTPLENQKVVRTYEIEKLVSYLR